MKNLAGFSNGYLGKSWKSSKSREVVGTEILKIGSSEYLLKSSMERLYRRLNQSEQKDG
jgi:hypothetical protein